MPYQTKPRSSRANQPAPEPKDALVDGRTLPSAPPTARSGWNRRREPNQFSTLREVAARLDVSSRTVSRWIASGELIAHRFGRSVRIADDDLRAFLARRRGM